MDLTFQVPMQYCSLQHQTLLPSPVTSTPGCCFCFGSTSSFFLELFLHWSPVPYWAPTDLGSPSFSVLFAFSTVHGVPKAKILKWFAIPLTTFCQNSPPWLVHLGWPYMACLIVSLCWTRLWSLWSDWLVFCDCGFHSVCPLVEKDKRLIEATWWERLTEGKTGSCFDGQGHAQ